MKLVLTAHELAEAIGYEVSTIRWMASAHPDKLPPRFKDGTRKLLWAVSDVEKWVAMRSHYAASQKVPAGSDCSTPEDCSDHDVQSLQRDHEHLAA